MTVLLLDDEKPALAVLEKAVKAALPDAETLAFSSPQTALEHIRENAVDAVFCDYDMPGMNGIEFAKNVKRYLPKTDIVFVTGYEEYAARAVNSVAPKGYILKPVSKVKIEEVLSNLESATVQNGLYIKTFGTFEVLFDGKPLDFKIKKAKELFAYLINSDATCTRRELTAAIYEDKDEKNAVRYLTDATKCLVETLAGVGCERAVSHRFNSYSVDKRYFNCDLYEYNNGNINLFKGEYMNQYSWAEYKIGTFFDFL